MTMKAPSADRVVIFAVLALSLAVTLLDFTGLLDQVEWLRDRVPVMTLLAVSLITATSLLDGDRTQRVLQDNFADQQTHLEKVFGTDEESRAILDAVGSRWRDREPTLEGIFDTLRGINTQPRLVARLQTVQEQFNKGEFEDGGRSLHAWDVTVMLMDASGRVLFHPRKEIIGTRPNMAHHRIMCERRTGTLLWVNQLRTPLMQTLLSRAGQSEGYKHDRLTKSYFREHGTLRVICVIESHLNVLYQLPTTERQVGT